MENQYCLDLALGFCVDPDILQDIDTNLDPTRQRILDISDRVDLRLKEFLYHRGIFVAHAEAFYTPPFMGLPIHVDTDKIDDHCKFNFVFGGEGSMMQWWAAQNQRSEVHTTPIGTRYLKFDVRDCDLVYQARVGQPSLVNAGRPHSVYNNTDQPRWCMSYVLKHQQTKQLLQWSEAVGIFQPFVKVLTDL